MPQHLFRNPGQGLDGLVINFQHGQYTAALALEVLTGYPTHWVDYQRYKGMHAQGQGGAGPLLSWPDWLLRAKDNGVMCSVAYAVQPHQDL